MTRAYPTYSEIRARRIADRRASAVRALRDADAIVGRAGGRLIVFGSLVEGRFNEGSDLDVAIFGVPPDRDAEIAAEVDVALGLAGFTADVIPERFLSDTLRERVLRNGRAVHTLD
jgi:predicted nucleotidyltransferase